MKRILLNLLLSLLIISGVTGQTAEKKQYKATRLENPPVINGIDHHIKRAEVQLQIQTGIDLPEPGPAFISPEGTRRTIVGAGTGFLPRPQRVRVLP